ncbi:MAG: hypothetical protein J0L84_04985, partial [Verrucomicrobia bacterium]|nr:hypothetical protein [Verrucomicrobiota bacterium]
VPPLTPAPMPAAVPFTAESLWSPLHASLERSERMLWTLLAGAQARTLHQGVLTVACAPDALSLLGNPKFAASLKQRARELGAGDVTVQFVPGEAPAIPAPPPLETTPPLRARTEARPKEPAAKPAKVQPVILNKDEFLKDPAIREAMEVFRAQLIEVRAPADGTA